MDMILDQSSEDLLCCRVCLMTDCKLFNIHEYKLADTLSRISGTPIFKGRLPQYLCTYCHTLLLKCAKFRMMCLRTDHCLKKEVLKAELNTDRIRRIDRVPNRLFHLTYTEVENIDVPPSEKINEPYDAELGVPKIERVYKVEPNTISIDDDETNSIDLEANMHTYNVKANTVYIDLENITADISSDDNEDMDEPNTVEIDEANINTVNTDAPNIHKVGVLKRNIDKGIVETRFNTVNIGTVRQPEFKNKDTQEARLNTVNIGTVRQPEFKNKDMQEARLNTVNIGTVRQPEFKNKDMQEARLNTVNIGTVRQPEFKNKDMQEARLNTVNIGTVRQPELKMELEMLKGQLTIKVVKDARVNNIPAMKRIKPEMEAHKVKPTNVSSVAKSMKTGKENNTMMLPRINTSEEKGVQIQIIKNSQDIFNNPGMLNPALVRKLNAESAVKRKRLWFPRDPANCSLQEFDYSKFERDHAVKIVILTKEEQLEEIAARKQSAKYTEAWFPCKDCGKSFGMEAAYKNHRQRHSPISGEYVCDICSVRFKKRSHRQGHLDTHRLKFNCERCDFVSRSKHQAKAHYDMHEGKTFNCPHCGNTYNKQSTYFSHVRIAHPAAHVACDLCGETFIGARGIYVHKQLVHKHAQTIKPQKFKCTSCSASFVSADALKTHADFGEHAGCPCERCGESCASETALQAHVGERHPTEPHRCEECNATFSSAAAFDVHHRRKHLNQRYTPPWRWRGRYQQHYQKKNKPGGQFMCEQCGRILPTAALLRVHMNTHLAVKPFACPQCPKTFATNYWRNEHVRRHTGEKPFQCDRCPRAFGSKSNMMRHYKVVHLGQHDNAMCSLCGRVCTTRASLRVHVRAVHLRQGWPKRPNRTRPKRAPRRPDTESSAASS